MKNFSVFLVYGSDLEAIMCFVFWVIKGQNFSINVFKTMGLYTKIEHQFNIGQRLQEAAGLTRLSRYRLR